MNHCIPGRKLRPIGTPIHQGLVVSHPMNGQYTHYVFRDKDSILFAMPQSIFKCAHASVKLTGIIRREHTLEYGDYIIFTADAQHQIIDYEKDITIYETDCISGNLLVKTLAVLAPIEKDPLKLWTSTFGIIKLSEEMAQKLHFIACYDVAISTWVKIVVDEDTRNLVVSYYGFESICVDDRQIAWDCDWNFKNKPSFASLTWEPSDDDDDFEQQILEKDDHQELDIITGLEGILIGQKELYCPDQNDYRIFIGLLAADHHKQLPLNKFIKFDVFYNDIRQEYIAYHYEVLDDELGDVDVELGGLDYRPLITILINFTDSEGGLFNTYFGLVSDPLRKLGTIPYMYKNLGEFEDDCIRIHIVDRGFDKLVRFEIPDTNPFPPETQHLIDSANEIADGNRYDPVKSEGFIINKSTGRLFSPDYPSQYFEFPSEHIWDFPIGFWIRFEAVYSRDDYIHQIISAEIIFEKQPIPHSRIMDRERRVTRHELKIDVELIDDLLFSKQFGYVSDPDCKFEQRNNVKKYTLIVEEDTTPMTCSLFKIVRMSKRSEVMHSQTKGNSRLLDLPESECDFLVEGGPEDLVEILDVPKMSQVDFNSEFAIRERKLEATKRKRERKKREKEGGDIANTVSSECI